jgi:phosphohistidine phosphatase SixA
MTDQTKQNNEYIDKIISAIKEMTPSKIINNNNNDSFEIESPSSPYFQFLKQIHMPQIPNNIAIIVGHSQRIKQMHKELLKKVQNETKNPNVYLFRHGHSCNNAKSKTKITDTMAAATLKKDWDPSLTTYGILTTLNIGMRNANLLNQRMIVSDTLIIYVSQLIRTWETAFLLWIGMLLKSYENNLINRDNHNQQHVYSLKLHINELLNEHKFSVLGKEFDRGNAPENRQHQVILFKQFIQYILDNIITENIASVSVHHIIGYELKGSESVEEEDLINIVINFKDLPHVKSEYLNTLLQSSDTNADPISTSTSTSTSKLTPFEQINKHNIETNNDTLLTLVEYHYKKNNFYTCYNLSLLLLNTCS